jgi:hypothetical protein
MGLGPKVGLAMGFVVARHVAEKKNLLRNPIKLAQQVLWGCHAPLDC